MNKAYLEIHEVQKLEQVAIYLRDKLLIRLLFHLGCRISEALALEVKDIDFDAGTVTIQHLKLRIKLVCHQCGARLGKSHSFCPKCGAAVKEAVAKEQEHRLKLFDRVAMSVRVEEKIKGKLEASYSLIPGIPVVRIEP
jgi:integrase/recombinase XerD